VEYGKVRDLPATQNYVKPQRQQTTSAILKIGETFSARLPPSKEYVLRTLLFRSSSTSKCVAELRLFVSNAEKDTEVLTPQRKLLRIPNHETRLNECHTHVLNKQHVHCDDHNA